MSGRPKSGLTKQEIQKRSDEKRGVKLKSFKLPIETLTKLEQLSAKTGTPQAHLIIQMIDKWHAKL